MAGKIYKYFPAEVMNLIFAREGYCGIKCSLPKDYNDPYELFLGVDLNVGPEVLATYREIVFEIPQIPTTCFSRSPVVTPMWAHYAQNHSGFVLEFDVDRLKEALPGIAIKDVEYRDEPSNDIAGNLQRAAVTKKPRHAVWLQDAVVFHAYFSKYTAWSYEQECRLVAAGDNTEKVGGLDIIYVPTECISAFIVGKNSSEEAAERSKEIAATLDFPWFKAGIGKCLPLPFLVDNKGDTFVFRNGEISEPDQCCDACEEPFEGEGDLCPWCSITEEHEYEAARGNPFRILDHFGQLEDYFERIDKIRGDPKKG